MVALLNPNTFGPGSFGHDPLELIEAAAQRRAGQRRLSQRQALDGAMGQATRPVLRVIEGGATAGRTLDSTLLGAVLAVVLLLAAVVGVRLAQGTPPESFGQAQAATLDAEVVMSAAGGDLVVEVVAGQNLWDIARSLDGDGDVRSTVDLLAEHNGGAIVTVGQRVVVPAQLRN